MGNACKVCSAVQRFLKLALASISIVRVWYSTEATMVVMVASSKRVLNFLKSNTASSLFKKSTGSSVKPSIFSREVTNTCQLGGVGNLDTLWASLCRALSSTNKFGPGKVLRLFKMLAVTWSAGTPLRSNCKFAPSTGWVASTSSSPSSRVNQAICLYSCLYSVA